MRKSSARVGWGLLALGLVGNAAGVVLSVVNDRFLQDSGQDVALTLAFGSFLVVGRPQGQGLGVVAGGKHVGAEGGGMVPGGAQGVTGSVDQGSGW